MIEVLAKEYERLYPDNKYHWNIPFCVEVLGYDPAEAEIRKKKMLKEKRKREEKGTVLIKECSKLYLTIGFATLQYPELTLRSCRV